MVSGPRSGDACANGCGRRRPVRSWRAKLVRPGCKAMRLNLYLRWRQRCHRLSRGGAGETQAMAVRKSVSPGASRLPPGTGKYRSGNSTGSTNRKAILRAAGSKGSGVIVADSDVAGSTTGGVRKMTTHCAACGEPIVCDPSPGGACWCAEMPPVKPVVGTGCLCRRCLAARLVRKSSDSESPAG